MKSVTLEGTGRTVSEIGFGGIPIIPLSVEKVRGRHRKIFVGGNHAPVVLTSGGGKAKLQSKRMNWIANQEVLKEVCS